MLRNVSAMFMKHVSSQHFCLTTFSTHDACTTDHLIGFVQVDCINGYQAQVPGEVLSWYRHNQIGVYVLIMLNMRCTSGIPEKNCPIKQMAASRHV